MHHEFIMRIWKSLLDDWFGVGASVFVVTPRIDSERLFLLMLLMIRNKGTGFQVTDVGTGMFSAGNIFYVEDF